MNKPNYMSDSDWEAEMELAKELAEGKDVTFNQEYECHFVSDPVFSEGDKWFFWDESQANKHGPFDTKHDARNILKQYAESL